MSQMEKQKVTIKQLAAEAGVSIATVSYVLNDRKDQKISEEKRKKILQLANLYHYVKNPHAASLALGQTSLIGVVFPEASSLLEKAETILRFERLNRVFLEKGYRLLLSDSSSNNVVETAAVLAYGLDKTGFLSLGDKLYVPLIGIDTMINDPLFNDVSDDFSPYLERRPLLSLPLRNSAYAAYLEEYFDVTYSSDIEFCLSFLRANPDSYIRDLSLIALAKEAGVSPHLADGLKDKKALAILERVTASLKEEGRALHLKL